MGLASKAHIVDHESRSHLVKYGVSILRCLDLGLGNFEFFDLHFEFAGERTSDLVNELFCALGIDPGRPSQGNLPTRAEMIE